MVKRVIGKTGIESSILGLGCMRLPTIGDDASVIDEASAIEMVRYAIDHGVTYIDTAYPYHGGMSEPLVGKALKDGYREKVTLVTKSPGWLIETRDDFFKYLDEQLEKLQTESLDIYLLHALNKERWSLYKKIDVFSAIEAAKDAGKIKNIGFSFHDEYEVFEEIVDDYDWDVCMLQLNFMDMEEQAGMKGLAYAESKGLPVIVMEPLKGGMLASPSDDIVSIWDSYGEHRSPVEWALRYVSSFENVKVVLSGMSTLEQIRENIELADQLTVGNMDQEALVLVERVKEAYKSKIKVPCTQCKYCVPCPHGVEIPRVFTAYNRAHIFNTLDSARTAYHANFSKEAKADNCVACGACEPKCPQKIEIISMLQIVAETFKVL